MEKPPKVLQPVADVARKVQLDFTLTYVECDLADKRIESMPVIKMFFSKQFVRDVKTGGIVHIHLDEDHLNTHYSGSIVATLDRKHALLPAMSGIGICSYAVHRNDNGSSCYVNTGTTHIFTGDILQEIATRGFYDHNHDLMMKTVVVSGMQPVKKGVIEMCINKIHLGTDVKQEIGISSMLREPLANIEGNVNDYIQSCMSIETALPDLLPNTERVRAPMDISEVGAEFTGGAFLPVAAYAMREPPVSNAEYWENAFQVIMARRNMTAADYHDMDDFEKIRTMGQMLCYAVQTFDYIGDAIELGNRRKGPALKRHHVGNEEFASIWDTLADDCEGGATGIYESYLANKYTEFDQIKHKHLIEMRELLTDYVPMSTLAIVHGAKIGDHEGFGAHMYMLMLPRHYVDSGLQRTHLGRKLLERLEPAVAPVGVAYTQLSRETRPAMFFEGTGLIDCVGFKDPLYEQYKYIGMNMQSTDAFKKRIPHEQYAPSPFYYANLFAITEKYVSEGVNMGGLILGTVNPDHDPRDQANSHEMLRGSLYTDMLACKDNLAIMPQPEIPESTMQLIEQAIAFCVPPRAHVLDKSMPLAGKSNPLWDKYVSAVASFGRTQGNKAVGSVDLIVRPHQFNESVINHMISESAQLDRIWAAEYVVEHITNSIYNYRIKLFVH